MTTILGDGGGWVDRVLVLDWSTPTLVEFAAGGPCTARHGLAALDLAVNRPYPEDPGPGRGLDA
jgi:hypothetical protein